MANNCLKQELKGSVTNPELPYFGALVIDVPALETADYSKRRIDIRSVLGKSVHLECVGGTFVNAQGESLGTEKDIIGSDFPETIRVSNTDCQVIAFNKYDINYIADWNENKTIKDLDYFAENATGRVTYWFKGGDLSKLHCNFKTFSCVSAKGNLSRCIYSGNNSDDACRIGSGITELLDFSNGCRGIFSLVGNKNGIINTEDFINCNFDQVNIRDTVGVGDVVNFVNSNLTTFDAIGAIGFSGSVEACMEKMWTLGIRSRTNMQFSKPSGVTLNGIGGEHDYKVDISNNGVVVKDFFTEAVVASYDGSTWTYA